MLIAATAVVASPGTAAVAGTATALLLQLQHWATATAPTAVVESSDEAHPASGAEAASQASLATATAPPPQRTYYDVLREATVIHTAGRQEEAAAIYKAVMEAVPTYSDAFHLYGIALLDLGRRAEALVYTQKAVEMSPLDANFHNSLGEVLRRNGSKEEVTKAAFHFRESLRLDPSRASVANNLGGWMRKNDDTFGRRERKRERRERGGGQAGGWMTDVHMCQ